MAMLAYAAFAQSQNGTLLGVVQDPRGKAIAEVEVQLSPEDASPAVTHAITDATGRFQCPGLPPGVYSLKLSLAGWQTQTISGLNIGAARTLDINIVLMPAGATGQPVPADRQLDRDALVETRFGEVLMHKLPTTRRIWALIENQAPS
ncbi:MAG TPA: carboxypeptidase-like regulatory domain-containing protein, partial [Pyrinomonadaceae bacterium]|nr:carboxypeptidase-like regulatory domain-containing protein [Pyrinomonadaceae bacterium]